MKPRSQTPDPEPGTPVNLTAQQQQVVKADTTKRLKDPKPARFGKMWAAKDKEGVITVKAPNTGFHIVKIGSAEKDQDVVLTVCRKYGVSIAVE